MIPPGKEPATIYNDRGQGRGFRVTAWSRSTTSRSEAWIEGDFELLADAKEAARRVVAEIASAAVVKNAAGTVKFRTGGQSKDDREFPISVTKLAGMAEPFRPTGKYRRR